MPARQAKKSKRETKYKYPASFYKKDGTLKKGAGERKKQAKYRATHTQSGTKRKIAKSASASKPKRARKSRAKCTGSVGVKSYRRACPKRK